MRLLFCLVPLLAAGASAEPPPARVIVVGVDGLGAKWVRQGKVPNLRGLMARGAWSLHARGVIPTVSSPNWASMIMGAGPAQHGIVTNEWQPDKFDIYPTCHGIASTFPTIFGILRRQRPASRIAVIHDWEGYARLIEPQAPTYIRHVQGSPATVDAAIQYWQKHKPDLMFVHLDDVDHAGHGHGWGSPEYTAAVEAIDTLIGDLVKAAGAAPIILVTADHGGNEKKHGGNTMAELEIPWILAGPGVPRNLELTAPINTYDTAATLARILGVTPPSCWIARPVDFLPHQTSK